MSREAVLREGRGVVAKCFADFKQFECSSEMNELSVDFNSSQTAHLQDVRFKTVEYFCE